MSNVRERTAILEVHWHKKLPKIQRPGTRTAKLSMSLARSVGTEKAHRGAKAALVQQARKELHKAIRGKRKYKQMTSEAMSDIRERMFNLLETAPKRSALPPGAGYPLAVRKRWGRRERAAEKGTERLRRKTATKGGVEAIGAAARDIRIKMRIKSEKRHLSRKGVSGE